ncbi:MAG TPA: DUF502 domain-containing protein [Wenzhouxiangella sp.]|nr:DUF502 domain-containing protein [Wenzhouxiangella sp.]
MTTNRNEDSDTTTARIIKIFFKGLATLVPIGLTLAIVVWLGMLAEGMIGRLFRLLMPETWYVPGMGIAGGIVIVFAVGLLSQYWLFRRVVDLGEALLDRMPLVKSIFRATKDFVEYFSGSKEDRRNQVVMVRHPELDVTMMGFVTRENFDSLPFGSSEEVAVYLPLSYQLAGYTVFIPKSWCEPVDMPFEDAMRLILTAAMTRRSD